MSKPEIKFLTDRYRELLDFMVETETQCLLYREPLEELVDEMPEVYGIDPNLSAIFLISATQSDDKHFEKIEKVIRDQSIEKVIHLPVRQVHLNPNEPSA